jgi:hypothetical protein
MAFGGQSVRRERRLRPSFDFTFVLKNLGTFAISKKLNARHSETPPLLHPQIHSSQIQKMILLWSLGARTKAAPPLQSPTSKLRLPT